VEESWEGDALHDKFVLFGTQHLIVIALTFAIPSALAPVGRWSQKRMDEAIRWMFAALLIGTWIAWYWLFIARNWLGAGNEYPMNLCDWATIALIVTLIRPSQIAFELAYFWALAGTMQGLITPDVNFSFPEPQFIVFLLGHGAIIAAVIYLIFGSGMRPYPISMLRVAGWTIAYSIAAALVDWLLDVNYGFFRAKPNHATFYDLLPDWPYYIPVTILIGIGAIVVLYAPWWVADWLRKSKPAVP